MITQANEDRAQVKLVRLLRLIDRMAGFGFPKTIKEIYALMQDNYHCERTVYRDVQLLETMGVVHHVGSRPTFSNRFGNGSRLYQINLPRSERLQAVAIQWIDGGDA